MTRDHHLVPLVAALCLVSAIAGRAQTSQTPVPSPVAIPQDFPEGPNRDVVVRLCRDCHPVTQVTRRRESRFHWSGLVEQMMGEGANITNEDFELVVTYLSVALGKKVKINEASAKVIAETFDISDEEAAAIVKYRTEKGAFKDWKAIASVPGIDAKRIEEQQVNLDFSSGS
jgi:competence protein ComEA